METPLRGGSTLTPGKTTPDSGHFALISPSASTHIANGRALRGHIIIQLHTRPVDFPCQLFGFLQGSRPARPGKATSAGHYRDNLSLYFIVISFSLSFIAIKKILSLSIYRYRDTFVPKSAIIDNKIQQVIEKQFHT